jgi:hypothetical protein
MSEHSHRYWTDRPGPNRRRAFFTHQHDHDEPDHFHLFRTPDSGIEGASDLRLASPPDQLEERTPLDIRPAHR